MALSDTSPPHPLKERKNFKNGERRRKGDL